MSTKETAWTATGSGAPLSNRIHRHHRDRTEMDWCCHCNQKLRPRSRPSQIKKATVQSLMMGPCRWGVKTGLLLSTFCPFSVMVKPAKRHPRSSFIWSSIAPEKVAPRKLSGVADKCLTDASAEWNFIPAFKDGHVVASRLHLSVANYR
jgi:hypothetical protein